MVQIEDWGNNSFYQRIRSFSLDGLEGTALLKQKIVVDDEAEIF